MTIVCIVGILGNVAAIIEFGRPKETQKNFYHFMFYLAVFDLIYLIIAVLLFILPHLIPSCVIHGSWFYIAPWAVPVGQISLTGSVYFMAAVTIERYLTVCHPFYMVSRTTSAGPTCLVIVIFSILYNIPKFFEMSAVHNLCHLNQTEFQDIRTIKITSEICESSFRNQKRWNDFPFNYTSKNDMEISEEDVNASISLNTYSIQPSNLRFNLVYVQVYTVYSNLIINGMIPFSLVIILNVLIVLNLQNTTLMPSPERLRIRKYMISV